MGYHPAPMSFSIPYDMHLVDQNSFKFKPHLIINAFLYNNSNIYSCIARLKQKRFSISKCNSIVRVI